MSFTDWVNGLIADGITTVRSAVSLAAIIGILLVGIKTRWAVASLVVVSVAAALVIWLSSLGGLELIASMFQRQAG